MTQNLILGNQRLTSRFFERFELKFVTHDSFIFEGDADGWNGSSKSLPFIYTRYDRAWGVKKKYFLFTNIFKNLDIDPFRSSI